MAIGENKLRRGDREPWFSDIACAVFSGAAVWSLLQGMEWATGRPSLHAWSDIALVHVLAAIPFGIMIAHAASDPAGRGVRIAVATLLLIIGLALSARPAAIEPLIRSADLSFLWRMVSALALATGTMLCVVPIPSQTRARLFSNRWNVTLAVGLWLIPPALYEAARTQYFTHRVGQLREQSRLGDCRSMSMRLLILNPEAVLARVPLRDVVEEVQHQIEFLEKQLLVPLSERAAPALRLERARQLAMLGRDADATDLALPIAEALDPTTDPASQAVAAGLLGTMQEATEQWTAALQWHRQALHLWQIQPAGIAQQAGLNSALRGCGRSARKLGSLRLAEQHYRQLLKLFPTADNHFLLAQFYEDTQQAALAHTHARQAMSLAPDRFGIAGRTLINRLATLHFGCLSVAIRDCDERLPP